MAGSYRDRRERQIGEFRDEPDANIIEMLLNRELSRRGDNGVVNLNLVGRPCRLAKQHCEGPGQQDFATRAASLEGAIHASRHLPLHIFSRQTKPLAELQFGRTIDFRQRGRHFL